MMNKTIAGGLLLTAGAVVASPVMAEDGLYFAAGLGAMYSDVAGYDTYATQNLFAKVGKEINESLSVEALLGIGIGSDKWTSANGCDSEEIATDRFIGVQVVGAVPLSEKTSFHGNLGIVQTTATRTISGAASCYGYAWSEETSDDETDLTYGIGIDYRFNPKAAITADYQIFYDDDYAGLDLLISGFVIGYKQYF